MLSGSCGTRDEPYIPRRPGRRLVVGAWLVLGVSPNIYKLKATLCGLLCLRKSVSRNSCLEWDAVSAWDPIGKVCPTFQLDSGMYFPVEARWESASHFGD